MDEIIRGEKVPANPIPERKYEQFKYKLEEKSIKYAKRNIMLFYLGVATGYRLGDICGLTIGEILEALVEDKFSIQEQKQYKAWQKYIKEHPNSSRRPPKKRESPIKANLRKLLKDYCKGKSKSSYAFESNKKGEHISPKAYSNILSEVGKELNLKILVGIV